MSRLLLVTSSLFGAESKSRQIALEFVSAWKHKHPGTAVVERDLVADPIPHLEGPAFAARLVAAESQTEAHRAHLKRSDQEIAELEQADVIVIAAPMYNFSIPSTLKAWIDHVVRAGRTFRYTATGPEGLLKNKKVFVVTARGGIYSEGAMKALDFHEPYLRTILGFIGLKDVTFIYAEGLAVSPDAAEKGIARAKDSIGKLVPAASAA